MEDKRKRKPKDYYRTLILFSDNIPFGFVSGRSDILSFQDPSWTFF